MLIKCHGWLPVAFWCGVPCQALSKHKGSNGCAGAIGAACVGSGDSPRHSSAPSAQPKSPWLPLMPVAPGHELVWL